MVVLELSGLVTMTEFLVLSLSIFVSLAAAYVVAVTEREDRFKAVSRRLLEATRLRRWFAALATGFFALFLDQFLRILPATPVTASVSSSAVLTFYVLVAYVVVDALFAVNDKTLSIPRPRRATSMTVRPRERG